MILKLLKKGCNNSITDKSLSAHCCLGLINGIVIPGISVISECRAKCNSCVLLGVFPNELLKNIAYDPAT